MKKEKWKAIPETDGYYEISNFGRMRSWKNGKWGKRDTPKILKLGYCRRGYKRQAINHDGDKRNYSIHRLVALAFIDNPESKYQVNHIDGDKTNNHIENLEWVTNQENMDHAHANDMFNYKTGDQNPASVLNKNIAESIRNFYSKSNITQSQIADAYLVSQKTISDIINCKFY